MRTASSPELAAALAERLNEVLPTGFAVHAVDVDLIVLYDGAEVGTAAALAIMETVEAIKHPAENLETAVRATLDSVQDSVAEVTTEPWPVRTGSPQPHPDARVTPAGVEMWFGDEAAPVLRLRPIALP